MVLKLVINGDDEYAIGYLPELDFYGILTNIAHNYNKVNVEPGALFSVYGNSILNSFFQMSITDVYEHSKFCTNLTDVDNGFVFEVIWNLYG